jgi:5-methylcytosine-specific restriction endonuclease McrA
LNRGDEEKGRALKYRENNRDKYLETARRSMAKRRATDPNVIIQEKTWRSANKDRVRLMDMRKLAKRRAAPIGTFHIRDWRQLKNLWGHRCAYCGKSSKKLTVDHMVPLARGGIHDVSNIVPACLSCNTSKCARTVEEYYQWMEERVAFYKTFLRNFPMASVDSSDKIAASPGKAA